MYKPLYASSAEGVDILFDAMRPGQAVNLGALVLEQLLHSCNSLVDDESISGVSRRRLSWQAPSAGSHCVVSCRKTVNGEK